MRAALMSETDVLTEIAGSSFHVYSDRLTQGRYCAITIYSIVYTGRSKC